MYCTTQEWSLFYVPVLLMVQLNLHDCRMDLHVNFVVSVSLDNADTHTDMIRKKVGKASEVGNLSLNVCENCKADVPLGVIATGNLHGWEVCK